MGLWSRLIGRRVERQRGVLAEEQDEGAETLRVHRPHATAGTPRLEAPQATPSMRPRDVTGRTAGTPNYRTPEGTPSTERIHNPPHPGV